MGRVVIEVRDETPSPQEESGDDGGSRSGCGAVYAAMILLGFFVFALYIFGALPPLLPSDWFYAQPAPTSTPSTFTIKTTGTAFRVGEEVVIVLSGQVHLRRTPGYRNKPPGDDLCGGTRTGERFRIIDGPRYVDELNWWMVSNTRCTAAWIAQNGSDGAPILGRP